MHPRTLNFIAKHLFPKYHFILADTRELCDLRKSVTCVIPARGKSDNNYRLVIKSSTIWMTVWIHEQCFKWLTPPCSKWLTDGWTDLLSYELKTNWVFLVLSPWQVGYENLWFFLLRFFQKQRKQLPLSWALWCSGVHAIPQLCSFSIWYLRCWVC